MKGLIKIMCCIKTITRVTTATCLVAALIALISTVMVGAYWVIAPAPSYATDTDESVEKIKLDPWRDVEAYVFDSKGHTFITVACIKGGMSIIHHPACACYAQEKSKDTPRNR